jgi:hypothetical protein
VPRHRKLRKIGHRQSVARLRMRNGAGAAGAEVAGAADVIGMAIGTMRHAPKRARKSRKLKPPATRAVAKPTKAAADPAVAAAVAEIAAGRSGSHARSPTNRKIWKNPNQSSHPGTPKRTTRKKPSPSPTGVSLRGRN